MGKKQRKNSYSIRLFLVSFEYIVGVVVNKFKNTNNNTENTKLIIRQIHNHPTSNLFSYKHKVKITKLVIHVEYILLYPITLFLFIKTIINCVKYTS